MFGEKFYNQALRKLTVAFGSLFNNIYVTRVNSAGTAQEEIRVPLAYGPKEKWIRKLREQQFDFQSELPRMSFEMVAITYDSARKKNSLQKRFTTGPNNQSVYSNFVEVPYDVEFEVGVLVKFMEDGLSVLEQILPYFSPEFTVSLNINDVNQNVDVPIVLTSVAMEEDYEGVVEGMRIITMTLSFTAKANIFGPVKTSKPIQTIKTTIFESESFYIDGGSAGISGATAALSKVSVGVTGPSGASSGVDNFTDFTTNVKVLGHSGGIDVFGADL
jgi:hypothetical protein